MEDFFTLITGRTKGQAHGLHSGAGSPAHLEATSFIEICPEDMTRLGIKDGQMVRLRSDAGRVEALARSRFWAQQRNEAPLPRPANLIMQGGTDTVEDMIASTERGVLLTRFWYIRGLNPRIVSYTGLTRDGTFLIEDGRITRPVTNFRFNQSLTEMLQNVEMIGPATRVAASENSSVGTPIVVPALKVRNFNLSSVSDAI